MIHNMVSGDVHILNTTARFIWENFDSQGGVDDLADGLITKYPDLGYQRAKSDVSTALEEFSQIGLFTDGSSLIDTEQNGDKQ